MSYGVEGLAEIPIEDDVRLYVYALNDGFNNLFNRKIESEYAKLGARLGKQVVLVHSGGEREFTSEVYNHFLRGVCYGGRERGFEHENVELLQSGIIITDSHPSTFDRDSLLIFAPRRLIVEIFPDLDNFIILLPELAAKRSDEFLRGIVEVGSVDWTWRSVRKQNPDCFGVGWNLGNLANGKMRKSHPLSREGIFISYRRSESQDFAARLSDWLSRDVQRETIFLDFNSIKPGVDFEKSIFEGLQRCRVFLPLIGVSWIGADWSHRSAPKEDWVYKETEMAVHSSLEVIPILLNGAKMPTEDSLPRNIAGISKVQGLRMNTECFEKDFQSLRCALLEAFRRSPRPQSLQYHFA